MEKFEIYEIPFIYQETKLDPNPVYKIRSVLVLGNDILVPVAKITGTISDNSKIYLIKDWQQAGLSKPSVIDFNRKELERRDTIQNSKYIGKLSDQDIQSIKSQRLAEDFDPFDTYSLQDKIYDFLYFLIDDMDYEEMISEVSDEFGMSPDEAEKYVKSYINDSEAEWHDTADLDEDYDDYKSWTIEDKRKYKRLLIINNEGGNSASDLEYFARQYQPDAEDMDDLTKETVRKVYDDLVSKYTKEIQRYGKDHEVDRVAIEVLGLNSLDKNSIKEDADGFYTKLIDSNPGPALQKFMNTDINDVTFDILNSAVKEFFNDLSKFPKNDLDSKYDCDKDRFYTKYYEFAKQCQYLKKILHPTGYGRTDFVEVRKQELCNSIDYRFPYGWKVYKGAAERQANLTEDYTKADDDWGEPYTLDEVFDQLSELTNDFTDKDGTVRCWYEQEKIYGVKVLKKYYNVVEVSDGRMSNEEDMSWVIAYSDPKETKKKSKGDK